MRFALDAPPLSEQWLESRWPVFLQFTLPSVLGQAVGPDGWLVFCDAASPEWFREEIESTLQPYGFHAIWLDKPFSPAVVSDAVATRARSGAPYLITTRLDNDDALAREFVATVHTYFAGQESQFVNFTYGLQLHGSRVYHRADPANAFASLIERRSMLRPRTVFVDQHPRLGQHGPLAQVRSPPMWLQVVHGSNVANEVRGVRARPSILEIRFDVRADLEPVSTMGLRIDQARTGARLMLRVMRRPHRLLWLWRVIRSRFLRA